MQNIIFNDKVSKTIMQDNYLVMLMDDIIQFEQKNNNKKIIFVLPESFYLGIYLSLVKSVKNILEEENKNSLQFKKGDILIHRNCVVEFDEVYIDLIGNKKIRFKLAEGLIMSVDIKDAPNFHKSTTRKPLSKLFTFRECQKHINAEETNLNSSLKKLLTSATTSLLYMGKTTKTLEVIDKILINNDNIYDLLLIGKISKDFNYTNINPGMYDGLPSLILSSSIFDIFNYLESGAKISNLLINLTSNEINNNLIILDDILKHKIPITLLFDSNDSLDLEHLAKRGFKIINLDTKFEKLDISKFNDTSLITHKVKNAINIDINVTECCNEEMERLIKHLYLIQPLINSLHDGIQEAFYILFRLILIINRSIVIDYEKYKVFEKLERYKNEIEREKVFLSKENYNLLIQLNSLMLNFLTYFEFNNDKLQRLINLVRSFPKGSNIVIVLPNESNISLIQNELVSKIGIAYYSNYKIVITNYSYYLEHEWYNFAAILTGWLGKDAMADFLFMWKAKSVHMLLYEFEIKFYNTFVDQINLKRYQFSEKYHSLTGKITFNKLCKYATNIYTSNDYEINYENVNFDEINRKVRDKMFSRYAKRANSIDSNSTVEAIPVSFVGGNIIFYKSNHKVVNIKNIIRNTADKITMITADQLKIGDYVVIRESDREVIKEIAYNMVKNDNLTYLYDYVDLWKKELIALNKELDLNTVYMLLKSLGCTKGYATISNWISDDDIIGPDDEVDIRIIAKAANVFNKNNSLKDNLENVIEAIKVIRSYHIKAGNYLSKVIIKEMKSIIAKEYSNDIEVNVEGIGTLHILEVEEIADPILIEAKEVNRLIKMEE